MNSNSPSFSEKTSKIAEYLVECAKKGKPYGVQSYGDVCEAIKERHGDSHSHRPQGLSRYLDAINKISYPRASVLLSVLVINKRKKRPGDGFFPLAAELRQETHLSNPKLWKGFFNEECERVYKAARARKLDSLLTVNNFHN